MYVVVSEKPVLGLQSASRVLSVQVTSCRDDTVCV